MEPTSLCSSLSAERRRSITSLCSSPSAQLPASVQGFEAKGIVREEGEKLLKRSVEIAREARDTYYDEMITVKQHPVFVAASVGSYGAYLADGSEYSGIYGEKVTLETLKDFHRRRVQVLHDSGADLIAFETIPNKLEAQVRELETDPFFNPGRGSALTEKGTVEMEASIMDGNARRCGAVSGVTTVKNPVSLARLVMEKTPHSYLAFSGAEDFARQQAGEIPEGFPFKIVGYKDDKIMLTREYRGETVDFEFSLSPPRTDNEETEEDTEEEDNYKQAELMVKVSKKNGPEILVFDCIAYPHDIEIVQMYFDSNRYDDRAVDVFSDFDDDLQKAFLKYMEIRGVKTSNIACLYDDEFLVNRCPPKTLSWREKFTKFFEKPSNIACSYDDEHLKNLSFLEKTTKFLEK